MMDSPQSVAPTAPWWKRALRISLRVSLTVLIIAGAGFAVQFGAAELNRRAEAAPTPAPAELIPVAATTLVQEGGFDLERSFVGQVEPAKTVAVSFELPGRLAEIAVDEGAHVTKGQRIATQDQALLEAERTRLIASRSATDAQLRFALQTVERNEQLSNNGFASQAGLDEALARRDELRARVAEIDAALMNVEIRLEKSLITAPFAGRVTERFVDGGETLAAGQRVLELVELGQPQVRIGVPLELTEDSLREAQIRIDGVEYTGRLATLRPDIDPVTRTRTAIFEIDADTAFAFGQTAQLMVTQRVAAEGVWVPTTSLREGVRGQWTILTVDAEHIVRAASVEILHAESERVFVRGAFPEGTMLIKQGPQRVTVGQQVLPSGSI